MYTYIGVSNPFSLPFVSVLSTLPPKSSSLLSPLSGRYSGSVVSTIASQQGGPGFKLQLSQVIYVVMFFPCLCGFPPCAPAMPTIKYMCVGVDSSISVILSLFHYRNHWGMMKLKGYWDMPPAWVTTTGFLEAPATSQLHLVNIHPHLINPFHPSPCPPIIPWIMTSTNFRLLFIWPSSSLSSTTIIPPQLIHIKFFPNLLAKPNKLFF